MAQKVLFQDDVLRFYSALLNGSMTHNQGATNYPQSCSVAELDFDRHCLRPTQLWLQQCLHNQSHINAGTKVLLSSINPAPVKCSSKWTRLQICTLNNDAIKEKLDKTKKKVIILEVDSK